MLRSLAISAFCLLHPRVRRMRFDAHKNARKKSRPSRRFRRSIRTPRLRSWAVMPKSCSFGDLAKNGQKEVLVANVLPNTPKSVVAGTVITRAVVAQFEDGKWVELLRCDEYLKNGNGYLGLTPLQPVTGWKLQYEDSPAEGHGTLLHSCQNRFHGKDLADCGKMESRHQAVPIHGRKLSKISR